MEKNKDKPFFLYLPHEAPHYPYQVRNDKAYRLQGKELPEDRTRADIKQTYKEMVEIMDENVGRVFEKLEELNLKNNTLVFFCSDNGATNMGSNGELNGFKTTLWEGGHRVPAIGWYPKKIDAGSTTDAIIMSMDILPTFLSIIGSAPLENLDGINFSELMFSQKHPEERPVFWRYRNQWVVRKGDWKYLKIKNEEYLFNLKSDLGEQNNLFDSNPEKVKELKVLLKQWETEIDKYHQQTN